MAELAVSLSQFIALNAAFSLGSDVTAQVFEGRRLCFRRRLRRDPRRKRRPFSSDSGSSSPSVMSADEGAGGSCAVEDEAEDEEEEERRKKESIDWNRALAFAGTGVLFCGVTQFVRLKVIDAAFDPADQSVTAAVMKTGVNQLVFSPVVRLASMATITYGSSRDWEHVKKQIRAEFFEAQAISYMVKPVSNLAAFALFPNHILMQAVVMRSASFAYNVYYSCVTHKGLEAARKTAGEAPEVSVRVTRVPLETVVVEEGKTPGEHKKTVEPQVRQMAGSQEVCLEDLRVIIARRRRQQAEWEGRQRRYYQKRRAAEEKSKQRGACDWLRGITPWKW
eukprot:Hpha_TRINITY_DN10715_c0_g1::TRINITY_DN10715_c0_g1_i1::g.43715::m.43715